MIYFYLTVTVLFLISYLFVPKAMWEPYFKDLRRWKVMAIAFFIIFIPFVLIAPRAPWAFALGFWLMDPWGYLMNGYQVVKADRETALRIKKWREQGDNSQKVE